MKNSLILSIRVIQQSTAERNKETRELFEKVKPLVDEGYSFRQGLIKLGYNVSNTRSGWYKALVDYARTQGYDHNMYKWKRKK